MTNPDDMRELEESSVEEELAEIQKSLLNAPEDENLWAWYDELTESLDINQQLDFLNKAYNGRSDSIKAKARLLIILQDIQTSLESSTEERYQQQFLKVSDQINRLLNG